MGTPMRNNQTMMGDNITLKRDIDKTKANKVNKKKNWGNKGLQGTPRDLSAHKYKCQSILRN